MLDADAPGDDGAKETLRRLHEAGVDLYLVWSQKKTGGNYAIRQPEGLRDEEWERVGSSIKRCISINS
jgi:hypothetical protein